MNPSKQSLRLTQVAGVCCEVTGRALVVKSVRNGVCLSFTVVANIRYIIVYPLLCLSHGLTQTCTDAAAHAALRS